MKSNVPPTIPSGKNPQSSGSPKGKAYLFKDVSGDLDVTVIVPEQNSAVPFAGDWDSKFEDNSKPNRRRIMNLMFNGAVDASAPVELRVTLHPNEQNRANVRLVFYNPETRAWQAFSDTQREGNELVTLITQWYADPGIGVDAD